MSNDISKHRASFQRRHSVRLKLSIDRSERAAKNKILTYF